VKIFFKLKNAGSAIKTKRRPKKGLSMKFTSNRGASHFSDSGFVKKRKRGRGFRSMSRAQAEPKGWAIFIRFGQYIGPFSGSCVIIRKSRSFFK